MKRLAIILILIGIGINLYSQNDTVIFSATGGFYENSFDLTISNNNPENRIFYTINGNTPTTQSYLYTQPLHLDENLYSQSNIYTIINTADTSWYAPNEIKKCIVIRAASFDMEGNCISDVITNSFFIKSLGCNMHGLPVLSICSDSTGLFDYENGICVPGQHFNPLDPLWSGNYFQKGIEWERLCNIEFYENNNTGINQLAGLRTHGNASRYYQQKSMKLYAREEYGKKKFNHNFFPELPFYHFKRLIIRPFRCSNWITSGIQDHIGQCIARSMDIDVLATRPTTVFLNGEYWGIYFLQESPDTHYINDHYKVDDDSCNIVKFWSVSEDGNGDEWLNLIQWLQNANLDDENSYDVMDSAIDINNFIDYEIFQIFSANFDWPANNVRQWQAENRKWRWILYDVDGCFFMSEWDAVANALSPNGHYPTCPRCTLVLRKLLENRYFSERFISRFHQLVNNNFAYNNTSIYLNSVTNTIKDEIPQQISRFNFPNNYTQWLKDIDSVNNFLKRQPHRIIQRIDYALHGVENYQISIDFSIFPNPAHDYINVNIINTQWSMERIDIFDLQGRTVYSDIVFCDEGENIHTIDIQNLPQGTYIVKVGEKTEKVVKIQ